MLGQWERSLEVVVVLLVIGHDSSTLASRNRFDWVKTEYSHVSIQAANHPISQDDQVVGKYSNGD